ncbi:MAG: protein-arginine deiminase [Myxococcaceae bacterium]|nr:protein-arginine deiminase [Myxococcaceae bacterium]
MSLLVTLSLAACGGGPVESFLSGPASIGPVTLLPGIEGSPCEAASSCGSGFLCRKIGGSGVCSRPGVENASCADTSHCAAGFICSSSAGAGVCTRPLVDLRVDVNRDGIVDVAPGAADDLDEDTWNATHGAIFLANIDDDEVVCSRTVTGDVQLAACNDAADEIVNGADDLLDMAVMKVAPWAAAPMTATGKLLSTPPGKIRIFKQTAGNSWELFDEYQNVLSADELKAGVELRVEGKDVVRDSAVWDGYVSVTLEVSGIENTLTDTVKLRTSPVMTFHHLEAPQTSYVTRVPRDGSSTAFVNALKGAIANTTEKAPLVEIADNDQWTQDFFETGYMTMPAAGGAQHTIRVAYRSASLEQGGFLRPAGRVVFTSFRGKDAAGLQAWSPTQDGNSSSLNSYGNTETIPPYSHNGQTYPLGRLLRGAIPSFAPDPVLSKMMESQAVQPHLYVDTSWLLVGHVDETISFLKAPNPRGWVLLVNDAAQAKAMLEAQVAAGNGNVQMHVGKRWYNYNTNQYYSAAISISQVLANTEIMAASAEAVGEVNAQLEIIKAATGITEAEIIRVPFLHYKEFGYSIAYQPGTVNGFVAGEQDFISPDPFGPVINGVDIFKKDLEDKLATVNQRVHWVDDWDLYHANMGEIHCGTNAARVIPAAKWWEGGR